MATGILDTLGSVNTSVAVDKDSITNIGKMLVIVIAIGLALWLVASKINKK